MPPLRACVGASLGGGDGQDVQAFADPADQRLDGKIGCRAGAEADGHAVLDERRGSFGGCALLRIAIAHARTALNTRSQLPAQTFATSASVRPRARRAAAISA